LIHNNLLSIFVIGTANGLAISLIVKRTGDFFVRLGITRSLRPGFARDIHPCLKQRAE
jgi:hypothetical protein